MSLIIMGLCAAASALGIGAGAIGFSRAKDAKQTILVAQYRHEKAVERYQAAAAETDVVMAKLGEQKVRIQAYSFKRFIGQFNTLYPSGIGSKLRYFNQASATDLLPPINLRTAAQASDSAVRLLGPVAGAAAKGVGTGTMAAVGAWGIASTIGTASTGTLIGSLSGVAAKNATLAWLGGGALSVGGGGMAMGTAVLGGIAVAPAFLVGGFLLAAKGEKAYTQAKGIEARCEVSIAEIDRMIVALSGIGARAQEITGALKSLDQRLEAALWALVPVVLWVRFRHFAARVVHRGLMRRGQPPEPSAFLSRGAEKRVNTALMLAQAVGALLDVEVKDQNGWASEASGHLLLVSATVAKTA